MGRQFLTLREAYKASEYRRFMVRHKDGRQAEFLGFGPDGTQMIGWWASKDDITGFQPDERVWTQLVTYV